MNVQMTLLEQAKDPSTPPKALERLATREDCRAAVAANPNTPVDVLFRLAMAFPREVAGNVGFLLSMMTEPERVDELEAATRTLTALCRVAGVPEAVMELGMRSPDASVQRALLVNPDLPSAYVKRLTDSETREIAEAAPYHRNNENPPAFTVEEVRLELLRGGKESQEALALISAGGVQDREVLAELAQHLSTDVRAAVARSPLAWPELLTEMSHDVSEAVRCAVAAHRDTPPKVLAGLAMDPGCQQMVAGNLSTEAGTLEYLAHARSEAVRELVAHHPNTPQEVLWDLSVSRDAGVRAAVAGNPNTPPEVLALLGRDADARVLEMLAHNPSSPAEALLGVALRGGTEALYELLGRAWLPAVPMQAAVDSILSAPQPPIELLRALAEHPSTPEEALWRLAEREQETGLGALLAHNPATPDELLVRLARGGTFDTRMALAGRPTLPPAALEALRSDMDADIRQMSEFVEPAETPRGNRNPYRGTDIAQFGIRSADDLAPRGVAMDKDGELRALRRTLNATSSPLGAFLAVTHPRFPEVGDWARVELDVDWYVRFAAACNPAAPREVLESLERDADVRVAAAAKRGLAAGTTKEPEVIE